MTLTIETGKWFYDVADESGLVGQFETYDQLTDYLASHLPELNND